jgi:hypothetical protein
MTSNDTHKSVVLVNISCLLTSPSTTSRASPTTNQSEQRRFKFFSIVPFVEYIVLRQTCHTKLYYLIFGECNICVTRITHLHLGTQNKTTTNFLAKQNLKHYKYFPRTSKLQDNCLYLSRLALGGHPSWPIIHC